MIDDDAVRRELIRLSVLISSFRSMLSPSEKHYAEGALMALTWIRGNTSRTPLEEIVPTIVHLVERQAAVQLAEQAERHAPIADDTPIGAVGAERAPSWIERSEPREADVSPS